MANLRKHGHVVMGGEVTYLFAVFSIEGLDLSSDDFVSELVDTLDWPYPHYSGPGRSFAEEPHVRCYKHAVLVTMRCGMDV